MEPVFFGKYGRWNTPTSIPPNSLLKQVIKGLHRFYQDHEFPASDLLYQAAGHSPENHSGQTRKEVTAIPFTFKNSIWEKKNPSDPEAIGSLISIPETT